MDVGDVFLDVVIKLPAGLLGIGRVLHAVIGADGIAGVEDKLQSRYVLDHFKSPGPAEAAEVHAVLMHRLDAGFLEHVDQNAKTAEAFLGHLVLDVPVLEPGKGHDADELGPEALHAGDGALGFFQGGVEGLIHLLGPVGHAGAEAVDLDAGILELAIDDVELLVGDVVDVGAIDGSALDAIPAEGLGRSDLTIDTFGGFVGESGEIHVVAPEYGVKWRLDLQPSSVAFGSGCASAWRSVCRQ